MNLQKYLFVIVPLFFVFGCNHMNTNKVKEMNAPQNLSNVVRSQTIVGSKPSDDWESSIGSMKSLSVITSSGLEIQMNPEKFKERFRRFPSWNKTEQFQKDFKYTLLLQSDSGPSKALSIAKNGIQWDNSFYEGDGINQLKSFIKDEIAQSLFSQLNPSQLTVESKDMGDKKQILEIDMKPIMAQLKKASYIQGTPRLLFPLFPYYVLNLDHNGKEGIRIDVMSPTLICAQLGEDELYFQTMDSMYTLLKAQIPFADYAVQNMKNMFKATDIQIMDRADQKRVLNREKLSDFEAQAVIQNMVRLMVDGQEVEGKEDPSANNGLVLLFTIGDRRVPVQVNENSFEFQSAFYQKSGILKDLSALMNRDELFKKVE